MCHIFTEETDATAALSMQRTKIKRQLHSKYDWQNAHRHKEMTFITQSKTEKLPTSVKMYLYLRFYVYVSILDQAVAMQWLLGLNIIN